MIQHINYGEKRLKKETNTPACGQTALAKTNYMLIILTSGPIFPA